MRRQRRTKAQWQSILAAQQSSGLAPTEYCVKHSIHLQTFYARRCELFKNGRRLAVFGCRDGFIWQAIVGWHTSKRMTTDLVELAFIKAHRLRQPPKGMKCFIATEAHNTRASALENY